VLSASGGAGAAAGSLLLAWGAVAMLTTLDSAWSATRWLATGVTAESKNPLLAMVPPSLVQTPLWAFLAALAVVLVAVSVNASLLDLMAPYATLFVGFGACLALQATLGRGAPDATLCFLLGAVATAAFGIGHFAGLPALTTAASVLPLLAAVPVLLRPVAAAGTPPTAAVAARKVPTDIREAMVVPASAAELAEGATASRGHFDGEWFNFAYTPTYDDTNSVGNVYWANYLRWVGKTREMFFAKCLPNFDLKTTAFYILTASIQHHFRSEAKEFEAVLIRLKVGKHNRKFATLEHEIKTADGRLLGKGEQQLMFVDSGNYRLVDIPGEVITAFTPFLPRRAGTA